jgi:hypothetical protein
VFIAERGSRLGTWYSDEKLEEVLKSYPMLKAQATVEAEELRYLFPSCTASYSGEPHGSGTSDSTGRYGVKRAEWSDNMKRARAIEVVYEALTGRERDFVKYMYFDRWGPYQVRLRLGVGKSHLFNIRREVLDKIAKIIL